MALILARAAVFVQAAAFIPSYTSSTFGALLIVTFPTVSRTTTGSGRMT